MDQTHGFIHARQSLSTHEGTIAALGFIVVNTGTRAPSENQINAPNFHFV